MPWSGVSQLNLIWMQSGRLPIIELWGQRLRCKISLCELIYYCADGFGFLWGS